MVLRKESKDVSTCSLVVAKGGPRLVESNRMCPGRHPTTVRHVAVNRCSLRVFHRCPHADAGPSRPTIFSAIQYQLGLKLESRKAAVDSYIIERVEKPSAN